MRTAVLLIVASLMIVSVVAAPSAVARPGLPPDAGGEVCVPGLTLCCQYWWDGDITPAVRCL